LVSSPNYFKLIPEIISMLAWNFLGGRGEVVANNILGEGNCLHYALAKLIAAKIRFVRFFSEARYKYGESCPQVPVGSCLTAARAGSPTAAL